MEEVDITREKDGGVLKRIIKEGTGDETPPFGSSVVVHYTGTFLDGTKFDSSRDRNKPFKFCPGTGKVIKAWEIGVVTMKKGEIALFTCAPEYAYGKTGQPTIPPNSTLKFEIEMISWTMSKDLSQERDGSIKKTVITPGQPGTDDDPVLIQESLVHVHLTGTYEDRVFEDRDVSFYLGEGEEYNVVPGVDRALSTFRKGEVSKVKVKSKYAFPDGHEEYGIPPNATVVYTVTLKDFEGYTPDQLLTTEEMLALKEKGTEYYKANKYQAAIKKYSRVKRAYTLKIMESTEMDKEMEKVFLSANLNLALCYLKTDENSKAIEACDKVLEIDPRNEKALFRRGQAYLGRASLEKALRDFQEVLKIEPKNTAAARQILVCNNLIKKQRDKEKRLYANMFDKFAREDKQNEEEKLRQQPDVMHGALGEWGQEERPGGRDATAFEKENPNILMLNANGTGEFQNM